MPAARIVYPEQTLFSMQYRVTDTDLNAGAHVGNSQYVEICNEVAERFFTQRGAAPYQVGDQFLINTGFSVALLGAAHLADAVQVDMGVDELHQRGCDFVYRMTHTETQKILVLARFSFLVFDHQRGAVGDAAPGFSSFFGDQLGDPDCC